MADQLTSAQRQRLGWVYQQLRIEFISAHCWRVRPDWRIKPRRRDNEFFFIPLTHRLDARVQRQRATVLPGQCMFVPTNLIHEAAMPTDCAQLDVIAIHAHLLPQWGGTLDQLLTLRFANLPDQAATESRLRRLIHLMHTDPTLCAKIGSQMLRDWLAFWTLNETHTNPHHTDPDPRIADALTMIHEQYDQPLTVELIADTVQLGLVQFRKLFKQAIGQGPKNYLAQYRLKQAAQRLRTTTTSVKQIAYATGFADPHYFHLVFRKQFGITPTTYRQRNHGLV